MRLHSCACTRLLETLAQRKALSSTAARYTPSRQAHFQPTSSATSGVQNPTRLLGLSKRTGYLRRNTSPRTTMPKSQNQMKGQQTPFSCSMQSCLSTMNTRIPDLKLKEGKGCSQGQAHSPPLQRQTFPKRDSKVVCRCLGRIRNELPVSSRASPLVQSCRSPKRMSAISTTQQLSRITGRQVRLLRMRSGSWPQQRTALSSNARSSTAKRGEGITPCLQSLSKTLSTVGSLLSPMMPADMRPSMSLSSSTKRVVVLRASSSPSQTDYAPNTPLQQPLPQYIYSSSLQDTKLLLLAGLNFPLK